MLGARFYVVVLISSYPIRINPLRSAMRVACYELHDSCYGLHGMCSEMRMVGDNTYTEESKV